MFRKKQDVAERSRSLLKSSAAKKFKVEILEQLPCLRKDVLDELMPTKVQFVEEKAQKVGKRLSSESGFIYLHVLLSYATLFMVLYDSNFLTHIHRSQYGFCCRILFRIVAADHHSTPYTWLHSLVESPYSRCLTKVLPIGPFVFDALHFILKDVREIIGIPLNRVFKTTVQRPPPKNPAVPNVFHCVVCRIDEI